MAAMADDKTTEDDKTWRTSSERFDRAEEQHGLPRAGQSSYDWGRSGQNRTRDIISGEEHEQQHQRREEYSMMPHQE